MLDQQHGAAEGRGDGGDAFAELQRLVIGNAGGRLVEQDDGRTGSDRAGDVEQAARADVDSADRRIRAGAAEPGEQAFQLGGADRAAGQADIFTDAQFRRDAGRLPGAADADIGARRRRQAFERLAVQQDGAVITIEEAGDGIDQCRLAGAVRADQADDRAGRHRQVDPRKGGHRAVADGDVAHFQRDASGMGGLFRQGTGGDGGFHLALRAELAGQPRPGLGDGLAAREGLHRADGEEDVADVLRQVQPAQEFREQHDHHAAGNGAEGEMRAGHGGDGEQGERLHHREVLGDQGAEITGQQPAGNAGDESADRKGAEFGARDGDAVGGGGAFGMAHRQPGGAEPRAADEFQRHGDDAVDQQHEEEIAAVGDEGIRAGDLGEARLAGEGDGRQHRVEGSSKTKCDDGEVDAAQAQRRQADGDADRHGGEPADQHPDGKPARRLDQVEITRHPGADAGKRHLAERDHAGAAGDEAEALQRDADDEDGGQQEDPVFRQ